MLFVAASLRGIFFGYVSEAITENIRKDVYTSVMRKHMGWHDIRTNNSGVITSILAGECSSLQGLSGEVVGVIFESIFSLLIALAMGFYFAWPMGLVSLGLLPILVIGATLGAEGD